MFEIKEGRDEDLLLESKKIKAEARKERMRQDNSGVKKSIYFIYNKVQYEIDNNIIKPQELETNYEKRNHNNHS